MKNITKKNQAQKAYVEIRKLLMARAMQPGERLTENSWAEKLNVNRADVKQAMARLLGEGLLMMGAKGGFFVRDFTSEELVELMDLRIILETAAAERAFLSATEEEINELEKIARLMLEMANNNYYMGFKEADLHFHEMFVKAAHNKKLESVYMLANLPISGNPKRGSEIQDNLVRDAEEHIKMVNSLRTKDRQQLIELVRNQLLKARKEFQ